MLDMSSGLRALVFLPVMLLGGCGDGSSIARRADAGGPGGGDGRIVTPISAATMASLEGTYALESFTRNPTACDVEGPAETSSHDKMFVLAGGPAPKPIYLGLAACSDPLECADQTATVRAARPLSADYGVFLDEEVGANRLGGGAVNPGQVADGMCSGRLWYESELTRSGDTVRVETRTIPLADVPSETQTCTPASPDELAREVQGRACSALRVISGRRTGPLP